MADIKNTLTQEDELVITDLETLKVISDPLRLQILEALHDAARTVKQIAAELNIAPSKLYYHINLMEEHGLIRVTDTRIVSGIIEKHYRATAHNLRVNHSLLSPNKEVREQVFSDTVSAMIDRARQDIQRSFEDESIDTAEHAPRHRKLLISRALGRLSPEQAEEFYRRVEMLIGELGGADSEDEEARPYMLTIMIHPGGYSHAAEDDDTPMTFDR